MQQWVSCGGLHASCMQCWCPHPLGMMHAGEVLQNWTAWPMELVDLSHMAWQNGAAEPLAAAGSYLQLPQAVAARAPPQGPKFFRWPLRGCS